MHLLCCFYSIIFHGKHLEAFEQDIFGWRGHSRREGRLQWSRRKAAQILNGQLHRWEGLFVSQHTYNYEHEANSVAGCDASLTARLVSYHFSINLVFFTLATRMFIWSNCIELIFRKYVSKP